MTMQPSKKFRIYKPLKGITHTFGEQWFALKAEAFARFFGTPAFLVGQTVIVAVWIYLNVSGMSKFDPYPFILLNLAFSLQAAYAAPLILLAQNRQADRDRQQIERDREISARTQADTEYLARELAAVRLNLSDVVTLEDLRDITEKLTDAIERLGRRLDVLDERDERDIREARDTAGDS